MEYEKAEATVVEFETEDIIATSGNGGCSTKIGCDDRAGVSGEVPTNY